MAVIGVNYNEAVEQGGLEYKGVYLYYEGNRKTEFNSGDFVKDWFDCKRFAIKEGLQNEKVYFVCFFIFFNAIFYVM